ncbi:MAG: ribosome maturation factor RimP [Lysobacteraceae bacterium]
MTQQTDQLEALLAPAVAALGTGVFVWGIQFLPGEHNALLRIYIDARERAVGIEDCEAVSREVSALLDVHDPIPGHYTLEVSSPGLDRPLFEPAHFAAYLGENAKLTFAAPQDGRRRAQGRLLRVEDDVITIEVDGVEMSVSHADIQKARLAPRFEPPAKPGRSPRRAGGKKSTNSQGSA